MIIYAGWLGVVKWIFFWPEVFLCVVLLGSDAVRIPGGTPRATCGGACQRVARQRFRIL